MQKDKDRRLSLPLLLRPRHFVGHYVITAACHFSFTQTA